MYEFMLYSIITYALKPKWLNLYTIFLFVVKFHFINKIMRIKAVQGLIAHNVVVAFEKNWYQSNRILFACVFSLHVYN